MTTVRILFQLWLLYPCLQLHANTLPTGLVVGWGDNGGGQATGVPSITYANGTFVGRNPFATNTVLIAGHVLSNAIAISAGVGHSLAVRADSTVVGWGGNGLGVAVGYETPYPGRTNGVVLLDGKVLSNVVSVAAGSDFSVALKKDGTVVAWGHNLVPSGLTNICSIAAEVKCCWALKRDGRITGWVSDPAFLGYGKTLEVDELSNIISIAVGPGGYGTRGVALKSDGTVGSWGTVSEYRDATPPKGLSNVVAIAAGASHSLALKRDSTVVGWGWNKVGEATGTPTINVGNAAAISAGQVSIRGELLSNVVAIAAGRGYSLALRKDGTVVSWGRMENGRGACVPSGLSNVVAIAAGADDFCLAITTNGAVAERFRQ